jgi:hypothetical protein
MYKHCFEPLPDVRRQHPEVPDGCWRIIERAMAKEPDKRHQTAHELLADLAALPLPGLLGPGSSIHRVIADFGIEAGGDAATMMAGRTMIGRVTRNPWVRGATLMGVGVLVTLLAVAVLVLPRLGKRAVPEDVVGAVGFGESASVTLQPGRAGVLTVSVPESAVGRRVLLRITAPGGAAPRGLRVEWRGPSDPGKPLHSKENADLGDPFGEIELPAAGGHAVAVTAELEEPAELRIGLSDQPSAQPGTVSLDKPDAVVPVKRGDAAWVLPAEVGVDEYRLAGKAGETVGVWVRPADGKPLPDIALFAPDGAACDAVACPGQSGKVFRLPRDGEHRLRLTVAPGGPATPYELSAARLGSAAARVPDLPPGTVAPLTRLEAAASPAGFRVVLPAAADEAGRRGFARIAAVTFETRADAARLAVIDGRGRTVRPGAVVGHTQFVDLPTSGAGEEAFHVVVSAAGASPAEVRLAVSGLTAPTPLGRFETDMDVLAAAGARPPGAGSFGSVEDYRLEPPAGRDLEIETTARHVELIAAPARVIASAAMPPEHLAGRSWTARLTTGESGGKAPAPHLLRVRGLPESDAVLRLRWVKKQGLPLPDFDRLPPAGARRGWVVADAALAEGAGELRFSFTAEDRHLGRRLTVRLDPPEAARAAVVIGPDGRAIGQGFTDLARGVLGDLPITAPGQHDLVVSRGDEWPRSGGPAVLRADLSLPPDTPAALPAEAFGRATELPFSHPGQVLESLLDPGESGVRFFEIVHDAGTVLAVLPARPMQPAPVLRRSGEPGERVSALLELPGPEPVRLRMFTDKPETEATRHTLGVWPLSSRPLQPLALGERRDHGSAELEPGRRAAFTLRVPKSEPGGSAVIAVAAGSPAVQVSLLRPDGTYDAELAETPAAPSSGRHLVRREVALAGPGDYRVVVHNRSELKMPFVLAVSRGLTRAAPGGADGELRPAGDLPALVGETTLRHFADVRELTLPVRKGLRYLAVAEPPAEGEAAAPVRIELLDAEGAVLAAGDDSAATKADIAADGTARLRLRPLGLPAGSPTAAYPPVRLLVWLLTGGDPPAPAADGTPASAKPAAGACAVLRLTVDARAAEAGGLLFVKTGEAGPRWQMLEAATGRPAAAPDELRAGVVGLPRRAGEFLLLAHGAAAGAECTAAVNKLRPAAELRFAPRPADPATEAAEIDFASAPLGFAEVSEHAFDGRAGDDMRLSLPAGAWARILGPDGREQKLVRGPAPSERFTVGAEGVWRLRLHADPWSAAGAFRGAVSLLRPVRQEAGEYDFEFRFAASADLSGRKPLSVRKVRGANLVLVNALIDGKPAALMLDLVAGPPMRLETSRPPMASAVVSQVPAPAGGTEPHFLGQDPDGDLVLRSFSPATGEWRVVRRRALGGRLIAVLDADPPVVLAAGAKRSVTAFRVAAKGTGFEFTPAAEFEPVGEPWAALLEGTGRAMAVLGSRAAGETGRLTGRSLVDGSRFAVAAPPGPEGLRDAAGSRWLLGRPAPEFLAVADGSHTVGLLAWNRDSDPPGFRLLTQLAAPQKTNRLGRVAVHPTGRAVAAAGRGEFPVYLWTLSVSPSGAVAHQRVADREALRYLKADVAAMSFSDDGSLLLTADAAGQVLVWTVKATRK